MIQLFYCHEWSERIFPMGVETNCPKRQTVMIYDRQFERACITEVETNCPTMFDFPFTFSARASRERFERVFTRRVNTNCPIVRAKRADCNDLAF